MLFVHARVCLTFAVVMGTARAAFPVSHYTRHKKITSGLSVQGFFATSTIQCGSRCTENPVCSCFSFDKATGLCYTARDVMHVEIHGRQFCAPMTSACPSTLGYAMYTLNGVDYCLKYYDLNTYGDAALAICYDDDPSAHFISVTSRAMLDELTVYLANTFNHGTATLWIDGRDVGVTDAGWRLQNGTGSWMTWFDWGVEDPDYGDDDCMRIEYASGIYKTKDMECFDWQFSSYHFKFLCQIDV